MNLYLKHPEYPNLNAHSHHVLRLLGIKGSHLPAEGMPPRMIQGITVWVEAQIDRNLVREFRLSRAVHRVKARCPECGKIMSVGRLCQHSKVHK